MADLRTELQSLVEQIEATPETLVRGSLALIPGGGTIDHFTFGHLDRIQMTRVTKVLKHIVYIINSESIQEDTLKRVNEYMKSPDGEEFFYMAAKSAGRSRAKEKRIFVATLFVNHASVQEDDLDEIEQYLSAIEELPIKSLFILKELEGYRCRFDGNPKIVDGGEYGEVDKIEEDLSFSAYIRESFNLDETNYYFQVLVTNAFAVDDSIARMDLASLSELKITKRGRKFLNYIQSVE